MPVKVYKKGLLSVHLYMNRKRNIYTISYDIYLRFLLPYIGDARRLFLNDKNVGT